MKLKLFSCRSIKRKAKKGESSSETISESSKSPAILNDLDVPLGYGLLVTLNSTHCDLRFVPDKNVSEIHPNIYMPKSFSDSDLLYGGGSGTTVFHGNLFGKDFIVKHGSSTDTKEIFALATLDEELQKRSSQSEKAAQFISSRIPKFSFIYLSPYHLYKKKKTENIWKEIQRQSVITLDLSSRSERKQQVDYEVSNGDTKPFIRITSSDKYDEIELEYDSDGNYTELIIPSKCINHVDKEKMLIRCKDNSSEQSGGYNLLKQFVNSLTKIQENSLCKVSLAQTPIGGSEQITALTRLFSGKLWENDYALLDKLLEEQVAVLKSLQALTFPEEKNVLSQVKEDLNQLEGSTDDQRSSEFCHDASSISNLADNFVGKAIKKNFSRGDGRFYKLMDFGSKLRSDEFYLTEAEEKPAECLGALIQYGADASNVYASSSNKQNPNMSKRNAISYGNKILNEIFLGIELEETSSCWIGFLKKAVNLSPSHSELMFTCGITDGGIHNMFLSYNKVWFFDLGEYSLMPLPAFLTKFLFSFFHTLGMQDDPSNSLDWVRRFEVASDGKLALTKETEEMLPQIYQIFTRSLNFLVDEFFDGENEVRSLLKSYVVLQLLSDASFCLTRWEVKGGGRPRDKNHNKSIEKWLWRALWDLYIAGEVSRKNFFPQNDVVGGRKAAQSVFGLERFYSKK